MLQALRTVGGEKALELVEEKQDDTAQKIVESWPTRLDTSKATALGFVGDGPLHQTLQEYLRDHGPESRK